MSKPPTSEEVKGRVIALFDETVKEAEQVDLSKAIRKLAFDSLRPVTIRYNSADHSDFVIEPPEWMS